MRADSGFANQAVTASTRSSGRGTKRPRSRLTTSFTLPPSWPGKYPVNSSGQPQARPSAIIPGPARVTNRSEASNSSGMLSTKPKTRTPAWLSCRMRSANALLRPQTASTWMSRGERARAAAYLRSGSRPAPPPASHTGGVARRGGRMRPQAKLEPHRPLLGEAADGVLEARVDRESGGHQAIGRHAAATTQLIGRLRWTDDAVGLKVRPCLVKIDPIRDHGDPGHAVGDRLGGDVVE